jgi:hypothetical protein
MTLAADEFIRRFLIHVLPKGFHRFRHYGLSAKTSGADNIARARELLAGPNPLDKLKVPIERSKGVPVSFANLSGPFIDKELDDNQFQASEYDVGELYGLEWRGKVVPAIRPDMTERQVREEAAKAAGNRIIKKL